MEGREGVEAGVRVMQVSGLSATLRHYVHKTPHWYKSLHMAWECTRRCFWYLHSYETAHSSIMVVPSSARAEMGFGIRDTGSEFDVRDDAD
eukprot:3004550-Rhodomonas_salina.5